MRIHIVVSDCLNEVVLNSSTASATSSSVESLRAMAIELLSRLLLVVPNLGEHLRHPPTHRFGSPLDTGLLALRVAIGCFMLVHGIRKLMGFSKMRDKFPDPIGMGSQLSLIVATRPTFLTSQQQVCLR